MAGSYNHIITRGGNLAEQNDRGHIGRVENLGDAAEAIEEMYGMIWWLAGTMPETFNAGDIKERVEIARQNYEEGLRLAKKVNHGD